MLPNTCLVRDLSEKIEEGSSKSSKFATETTINHAAPCRGKECGTEREWLPEENIECQNPMCVWEGAKMSSSGESILLIIFTDEI